MFRHYALQMVLNNTAPRLLSASTFLNHGQFLDHYCIIILIIIIIITEPGKILEQIHTKQ